MSKLVVHHLNNSRSHRILWMLEELGLEYEFVVHLRNEMTRLAPDSLKAVHPLGKSPVLVDDGRAIIESGAIIEHLCIVHGGGRFWPRAGAPEALDHLQWMHYAEGSAMLPLLLALYSSFLGDAAAPLKPRVDSEIALHLGYIDAQLQKTPFIAGGEFMAADVQISFVLEAAGKRLEAFPAALAYREKLQDRPGYRRAIEKGGPYALMAR